MGALVRYECSCGFKSGDVALGPAPRPDQYDPVLVSCPTCHDLTSVHRPEVAAGCPVHHTALVALDSDSPVSCPRCGNELQDVPVAIWD